MDPRQLRADQTRRRRRVRRPAESDPADVTPAALSPVATTPEAADLVPEPEPVAAENPAERGLRGLVGGGTSQVKPSAALRARDAARPREADLARSEAELVIVRRNWAPRH